MQKDLKSLKLMSGDAMGIEASWEEITEGEDGTRVREYSVKDSTYRHEDLDELVSKLKKYVLMNFGFTALATRSAERVAGRKKLTQSQEKEVEIALQPFYERIEILGFKISGGEERKGMVISAKMSGFNNRPCALNTPLIIFSQESLGIEQELEELFDEIEEEVFKFIVDNKKSQLEFAFGSGGDEKVLAEQKED